MRFRDTRRTIKVEVRVHLRPIRYISRHPDFYGSVTAFLEKIFSNSHNDLSEDSRELGRISVFKCEKLLGRSYVPHLLEKQKKILFSAFVLLTDKIIFHTYFF